MALWTPARIAPSLWIDFSDAATLFDAESGGNAVTNGVGIARAEDKSGNGRHFTQATAGARPTWTSGVQNSLGIARFDGGDRLTSISANSIWNFLHNATATIFVINKNGTSANPVAAYGWLGNNGASGTDPGWFASYDDRAIVAGLTDALLCGCAGVGSGAYSTLNAAGNQVVSQFRNVFTPNAFGVSTLRSDPANATAANRLKLAVNGGTLVGNNERSAGVSSSDGTFALEIGTTGNAVRPMVGDYSELLIFNSLLSTTDQQLVEGYAAWKWGTQGLLPANHPYKNAAPEAGSIIPILRQHYAAMGAR
jgi:hypothetical protein